MTGTILDSLIDLSEMYTPIDRCSKIKVGDIDKLLVRELRKKKYDQAPVVGSTGNVVGLIGREQIDWLRRKGEPLTEENQQIDRSSVPTQLAIGKLLKIFSEKMAVIVSSHKEAIGLLTLSDLNKPLLRLMLYPSFVQLETLLADFISKVHKEPWVWIKHLSENDQVRLLGYWELTKKRNIELETGPLHVCDLSDLITIVSKDKELRGMLHYQSNTIVKSELGALAGLRNAVMHPVRPILLSRQEATRLRHSLEGLENGISRLSKMKN